MNNELIDRHLDAILSASGSALRNYSMQKTIDDMRSSLMAAINDSALTQRQGAEPDGKAATYYAISSGDHVQFDTNTGQLEIYETEGDAITACPRRCEVIKILVRRAVAAPSTQGGGE